MGKSRHSKNNERYADREYMDGYGVKKSDRSNRKEKRVEYLLRTKNIENYIEEQDEGRDPNDWEIDDLDTAFERQRENDYYADLQSDKQ